MIEYNAVPGDSRSGRSSTGGPPGGYRSPLRYHLVGDSSSAYQCGALDETVLTYKISIMGIDLIVDPKEDDVWFVRRNLREYNKKHFETLDYRRFVAYERSATNETVGGIVFNEFGKWLEIEYLWVRETHRGKQIGTNLLQFAMDHARDDGRSHAMAETFSFQALTFYTRFGFRVEYEQKGYPVSSSRYFITSEL